VASWALTPPKQRSCAQPSPATDGHAVALAALVAGISRGRPAASQAFRVTFIACIPTWLTHQPITRPTTAGPLPERSNSDPLG
jgi:hypothetical protein